MPAKEFCIVRGPDGHANVIGPSGPELPPHEARILVTASPSYAGSWMPPQPGWTGIFRHASDPTLVTYAEVRFPDRQTWFPIVLLDDMRFILLEEDAESGA